MEGGWICLVLSSSFAKKDDSVVRAQMGDVFGDDFQELLIPDDGADEDMGSYCFVRCGDYASHINSVATCAGIVGVLPSIEDPAILPDEEVEKFVQGPDPEPIPGLSFGDVVVVLDGYLSDLQGIVTGITSDGRYQVWFKMNTRSFCGLIYRHDLDHVSNMFSKLRVPVRSEGSVGPTRRVPVIGMARWVVLPYMQEFQPWLRVAWSAR